MLNRTAILVYFGYFFGHSRTYLTGSSKAKDVGGRLAIVSIRRIFAQVISIWGSFAGAILVWVASA